MERNGSNPNCFYTRYPKGNKKKNLTVRLLVPGTRAGATKLLGFATARVRDQESAVVLYQNFLNFPL
jgi:hypothetical protein